MELLPDPEAIVADEVRDSPHNPRMLGCPAEVKVIRSGKLTTSDIGLDHVEDDRDRYVVILNCRGVVMGEYGLRYKKMVAGYMFKLADTLACLRMDDHDNDMERAVSLRDSVMSGEVYRIDSSEDWRTAETELLDRIEYDGYRSEARDRLRRQHSNQIATALRAAGNDTAAGVAARSGLTEFL